MNILSKKTPNHLTGSCNYFYYSRIKHVSKNTEDDGTKQTIAVIHTCMSSTTRGDLRKSIENDEYIIMNKNISI